MKNLHRKLWYTLEDTTMPIESRLKDDMRVRVVRLYNTTSMELKKIVDNEKP